MSATNVFSLSAIRTDGWFERVGERVGSFESLCHVLGERFFAFSLITGARIIALTVDRRNPAQSVVEFEISGAGPDEATVQSLSLANFQRRLVSALVTEEKLSPAPTRETDIEGIQRHLGVRYLLLAPLFGYSLVELTCQPKGSLVRFHLDGDRRELPLEELQAELRRAVLDELEQVQHGAPAPENSGLDLGIIPEARAALERGEPETVVDLLGGWLMPLSFHLRTPEGRAMPAELRGKLADALGTLGRALIATGDVETGQQCLRLSVQYAVDSPAAGEAYARLGEAFLGSDRFGEAIGPLRRAAELGAAPERVWPALGRAYFHERRLLAAWGATLEAEHAGVGSAELGSLRARLLEHLPELADWERLVAARGA